MLSWEVHHHFYNTLFQTASNRPVLSISSRLPSINDQLWILSETSGTATEGEKKSGGSSRLRKGAATVADPPAAAADENTSNA